MKTIPRSPGPLQRTTRIALAVLLLLSHPLWAATIIVDETTCTLVDAIDAANMDSPVGGCAPGSGADTIELTTDVTLTEVNNSDSFGDTGLPIIESDITIEGGDFTIERALNAPAFRLFKVAENGTLTLKDLTAQNGTPGTGRSGGAIINRGTVNLMNSTVSNNSASHGGGIRTKPSSSLTVTNSSVSDNVAIAGGGIHAVLADVALTNSTLSGNDAATGFGGGAVYFYVGGSLTITNCTVSDNSAFYAGGGLLVAGYAAPVGVTHSTFSGNSAPHGGAMAIFSGPSMFLANTVVANSLEGGNCAISVPTDLGNNFADDDTCGAGFGTITGLDPDLKDNGGPTLTHALRPHSTARDAAGDCGLGTDQRGAPRDDGACDSGAFEFQGVLCGNGQLDPGEECDDANDVDGDGCDSNCTVTRCGNGIVTDGEECDDGNQVSCDGCSSDCVIEEAYVCGDGIVDPACEECDDGNNLSCDGCSENCQYEVGYICGDGMVNPDCGEECDDGNNVPCDGCSGVCETEIGGICGDGILNTDCEECDDGNTDDGDGCAADCTIEQDVPATTYRGMAVAALSLLVASTAFLLRRRTAP